MRERSTGAAALASLRKVAAKAGHATLAEEFRRIGPIEVQPCRHPSVADQLYVEAINQQLSLKAANTIWARVVAAAAQEECAPAQLFDGGYEDELRACGVSGRKVKTLHAIRAADVAGLLDKRELALLCHQERASRLCSIWGIGKWTADMVGIFHFLDPDIWPEGDVAAVGGLRRLTGQPDTVAVSQAFAPYRSYLARYMWLSRDKPGSIEAT